MELQTQINRLDRQVETLNQAIEQLTKYIVSLVEERQNTIVVPSPDEIGRSLNYSRRSDSYREMMRASKDILLEDNDADVGASHSEKTMSPELQIQRLTAQLTAAYNRIAALEEQLLSQRIA